MKKCPYCAEEIQDAAIVCKHCGRNLTPVAITQTPTKQIKRKTPVWLIVIILICFFGLCGLVISVGNSATPTSKPPKISTATSDSGSAHVLSAKDVLNVDAVHAVETDGYTVTSAVCEVVSPISYLPSSSIFGGQLVFHAFRLTGHALDSETVVLFASNHTAANGGGLVIPINAEAISLNEGFPAGSSAVEPITVDTPGAETALACARQAGKPASLELDNFDVEAWRHKAIGKFGPEQTNADGSKDDYVRLALSLCKQSSTERETMRTNLGAKYEGSLQQFVIETFCPYAK